MKFLAVAASPDQIFSRLNSVLVALCNGKNDTHLDPRKLMAKHRAGTQVMLHSRIRAM